MQGQKTRQYSRLGQSTVEMDIMGVDCLEDPSGDAQMSPRAKDSDVLAFQVRRCPQALHKPPTMPSTSPQSLPAGQCLPAGHPSPSPLLHLPLGSDGI